VRPRGPVANALVAPAWQRLSVPSTEEPRLGHSVAEKMAWEKIQFEHNALRAD
jgi:hypothetical protein